MRQEEKENGAYGENVPTEQAKPEHGIREKTAEQDPDKRGNEQEFDAVRKQAADEADTSGGMGRTETPRDGASQGEWHQPDDGGSESGGI
jgi:hypothetical protein